MLHVLVQFSTRHLYELMDGYRVIPDGFIFEALILADYSVDLLS